MANNVSPRRRQVIEWLTTAFAVFGAWLLPERPIWLPITLGATTFVVLAIVWWRLRDK
ncbi:MAG: hypothetical protein QOI15_3016 [Pseudonocardiales bacterium]|jgi:membrane protein implicated in regulation of membrane protease activity|nr:hypothetical protein [Pseudonocardiales bacterium]MDT4922114.1 hypothetical protein [Pseudonocardiales bacterium]MDT4942003.1 hypothetical protein [Pseudonocardiales bacterium]